MKRRRVTGKQRKLAHNRRLFIQKVAKKRMGILKNFFESYKDTVQKIIGFSKAELTAPTNEQLESQLKAKLKAIEQEINESITGMTPELEKQLKLLSDINAETFADYYSSSVVTGVSPTAIESIKVAASNPEAIASKATRITDSMRESLNKEINKGIEQGLSFQSIVGNIEAQTESQISKIETTVRHETATTASEIHNGLANEAGFKNKMWIHAGGGKTNRPEHEAMDGVVVPIDEPFIIEGDEIMYPKDPNADIGQTINCYCQIEYVN